MRASRHFDPDPRAALCPVDGFVSQAGRVAGDTVVQAKGMAYTTTALLGGDAALAAEFAGGHFATLYLAPHNYHRVHMPLAGTLRVARFVPGDLFSVNSATAASVPRLFARNERVACVFDTAMGPMAVILVGALFVGSMSLAWTGTNHGAEPETSERPARPRSDHRTRPRRPPRLVQHGLDSHRVVSVQRPGARRRPGGRPRGESRRAARRSPVSDPEWRPTAGIEVLRGRAAMLARVRSYFASQEVIEVQTPLLSAAAASDPQIESIVARPTGGELRFLHTSPEFAMKRLLAAGIGDCYQVCPVFRDGEAGRLHNPEFTMIEWYRLGYGVAEMQQDVDRLFRVACGGIRSFPPSRTLIWKEAIVGSCGLDPGVAEIAEIRTALAARGVEPSNAGGWDRDDWLDLLMGALAGPGLGHDAPVFIRDYPASQASLARLRVLPDGSSVAERFELYVDGLELANGFLELGDGLEQGRRFAQDQETRRRRGQAVNPLDERLLAALGHGLPDCAGVALGFDRLVMAAFRLPSLGAAMAFPHARA